MPIPNELLEKLEQQLKNVVLASKLVRDEAYWGFDLFQDMGRVDFLKKAQENVENFLRSNEATPEDRDQYAALLHKYALQADVKKGNVHGWNASRDYRNAYQLYQKASEFCSSPELKATILIDQANFHAEIAKNSSSIIKDYQKPYQEIKALYNTAGSLGNDAIKIKADQGIAILALSEKDYKARQLQSLLKKFLSDFDRGMGYSQLTLPSAEVRVTHDGKILIDPTWSRYKSGTIVESILTDPDMLGGGVGVAVERHSVRSNKFFIEPKDFDAWIKKIEEKKPRLAQILEEKEEQKNTTQARTAMPALEERLLRPGPDNEPNSEVKHNGPRRRL